MPAPQHRTPLLALALATLFLVAGPAHAATPTPILVEGDAASGSPDVVPATETEPTSIVGRAALDRAVAATGNYDEAMALTPSVLDIDPNGPGLGETQTLTIRGFADGQYNVTFDGIPFGDSDDFTHHSAAYFLARDLGSVTVDRGPGDATTIGDATFGGSVALRSIDPETAASKVSPDIALGSYGTVLGGVRLDSASGGGGHLVVDAEGERSDGALDDVGQTRATLFTKLVLPLGARTELTVASNLARTDENDPPGATRAEIAANGPGFALSGDPSSQAFKDNNRSSYRTDISYAALSTTGASGWSLSDTLYSYGLDRHFLFGLDPNGETPNGTSLGPADVPAQAAKNGLRAFGDILRGSLPLGRRFTLRSGFWVERQANSRQLVEVDATRGDAPNRILAPVPGVPGSSAIEREQADSLVSFEPCAQIDWQATTGLLLSAGLKGAVFARSVKAPVMQGTRLPTGFGRTFSAPLPSLTARLRLSPAVNLYGQVARGFLAPPLQLFDVSNPSTASVAPEETWNFQVGLVWHDRTTNLGVDAYEILFTNQIGTRTVGGETTDINQGSATYRGLEAEWTQALGAGFALAGSASVNGGRQSGGSGGAGGGGSSGPVPNTPQATIAAGLLYNRGGWDGSLFNRWTGGFFGDVGGTEWIDPANSLDLSVGHRLRFPKAVPIRVQAQIFNLLDRTGIDGLAGYTAADTTPLFWTQAGRSLFISATASF